MQSGTLDAGVNINIGTRYMYSHSKTPTFMDVAPICLFFVNFQVFEWLYLASIEKIDVLLLIMQV